MLRLILHHIKIKCLFYKKTQNNKLFSNNKKQNNSSDYADRSELYSEWKYEDDLINFQIELENTTYFSELAQLSFLEIKSYNDTEYWVASSIDPNRKVLSNKAISELKNYRRNELKYFTEQFSQIFTILIGLIGTIIGLITVINK